MEQSSIITQVSRDHDDELNNAYPNEKGTYKFILFIESFFFGILFFKTFYLKFFGKKRIFISRFFFG